MPKGNGPPLRRRLAENLGIDIRHPTLAVLYIPLCGHAACWPTHPPGAVFGFVVFKQRP